MPVLSLKEARASREKGGLLLGKVVVLMAELVLHVNVLTRYNEEVDVGPEGERR